MCLSVTGLRGAFSHRVVSEACHVLKQLWSTISILPQRTPDTHTDIGILYVCLCVLSLSKLQIGQKMFFFLIISSSKNVSVTFSKTKRILQMGPSR